MNYYEILEVNRKASQSEIRKHYKALVKKYHPDLYEGDKKFAEDKTMQINMAYDVLSVPELREEYDLELELEEEEKNGSSSTNSNNYNQTYTTNAHGFDENEYMNDPVFRNMYERYNMYKNNYIFHKKYSKQGPYSNQQYSNPYTDKFEQEFDKHVRRAEGYIERKIAVLKLKQKILLAIIALLLVIIFIMISLHKVVTLSNYGRTGNNGKQYEPKEYNVKSDDKNDKESFIEQFIQGLYNSYVTDEPEEKEHEEGFEPDVPLEDENKNDLSLDNLKEKFKDFKFNIGNYEINTDVLNGISNDVKGAVDYYYNALKDVINQSELSKYSEEEIKTIIYEYLQKNHFNWYEEGPEINE